MPGDHTVCGISRCASEIESLITDKIYNAISKDRVVGMPMMIDGIGAPSV